MKMNCGIYCNLITMYASKFSGAPEAFDVLVESLPVTVVLLEYDEVFTFEAGVHPEVVLCVLQQFPCI